ncbi:MAG: TfpX/TfpZ family type IV pilin accessory protein [Thiothrix sp.]|uniref:TfpX/TfpZ family type IV pilin accessory protein n=1 Tax=Thiothrix sp. TaxID=1032 RepID=UPI00261072A6|nr:TfpX/TfpZ family type IV pilin accessory protein [Thiothrix sp.]MDD5391382.1 TfpX/TfpZ family type IV pilin accessory protein [Thiothrix sp.]
MFKEKLKALSIHLTISTFIVGCFLIFSIKIWYPSPLLEISGLKDIIIILLTVDLILGPLLTFVVFKPQKPSLKFDLTFIGLVQIAALAYGMFTIYQGHPVYVAYTVDRFTLINVTDVNSAKTKHKELNVSGWWKPKFVYVKPPTDPKITQAIVFEVLSGKPDIDARPEYYEPFEKFIQDVLKHGIAAEKLTSSDNNRQKLAQFLSEHGKTASDYAFLPLSGKEKDVIWALSRETGKPVGVIDINPWQLG